MTYWKRPAVITALALMIPLLGNTFVDGWDWAIGGFILAGTLIFGASLTYEVATRSERPVAYRVATGIALVAMFLTFWINMVVTVESDDPVNLARLGVPLVGVLGVALARFRPGGMARALFATALAQGMVPLVLAPVMPPGMAPATVLNVVFVALFAASGLLFAKASRHAPAPAA